MTEEDDYKRKYQTRRAPKKPKRIGSTESVADLLPLASRGLRLDQKVKEWSLLALWADIVDMRFKTRTRAVKLAAQGDKRVLRVQASDAGVASELGFCVETYRAALNKYAGQTGLTVDRIEVRVTNFKPTDPVVT